MGRRRLLIWAAVALVAVDLVFFSGASYFLAAPQSRLLNQVIVLASVIAFGIATMRGHVDLRSPLVLPGLAWIAATAIAAAISQRPANSLEGLALLLIAAPAYLVIRAVVWSDWLRPRVDGLVVVATAVFVVAYLVQALTQWISWWSVAGPSIPPLRPGDVGLTAGTVNAVSMYLELLAPIAIWLSWTMRRSRPLSWGLAIVSLAALVITGSRGAWLGALVGGAVLAVAIWSDRGRPIPRLPADRAGRTVLTLLGVVAVAAIVVVGPSLASRFLAGDAGRIELWSAAWWMFTQHPLAGVGQGAFPDVRALTPISEANLAVLTTSHNSVLQVLAETGIVGLLAVAWLLAVVAQVTLRAIRTAPTPDDRVLRQVCAVSLIAVGVHSLVDTQFHLPAIVILTLHLVARLDPPVLPRPSSPPRAAIVVGAVAIALGAVLLVPIDVAMIRATIGNSALDRGDAAAALPEFEAAASLHELGPYRLGEAIARSRLADPAGADRALERLDALQPFTFVVASRASLATSQDAQAPLLARLDAGWPYDATASVNAAVVRFPTDPAAATADLAAAMVSAPPLIFSTRPPELFDDATWNAAQRRAIERIALGDPASAAAFAIVAGHDDVADRYRAFVPADTPEGQALALLFDSVRRGQADIAAAQALLRRAPGSPTVHAVLWTLGFQALSQPLIDDVTRLSIVQFFGVPYPPLELVVDGRTDAEWSLRLPRYPMASNGRNGPKRPYLAGMVTIEPVFRPGP